MTRMQRSAIVAFSVVLLVLSVWLGSVWAKPTIGNLISSAVSFALLVNCYVYSMRYGLRRYQIERQELCSLKDYLRDAGYIHPLLW
jgi:membrane protein YdbS with pleckstrin-like domain